MQFRVRVSIRISSELVLGLGSELVPDFKNVRSSQRVCNKPPFPSITLITAVDSKTIIPPAWWPHPPTNQRHATYRTLWHIRYGRITVGLERVRVKARVRVEARVRVRVSMHPAQLLTHSCTILHESRLECMGLGSARLRVMISLG